MIGDGGVVSTPLETLLRNALEEANVTLSDGRVRQVLATASGQRLAAEAAPLLAAVTDVLREWDRRQSPDPGGWHGRALVKAVNRLRALLPAEPPEAP